jgi:hypothetical protein
MPEEIHYSDGRIEHPSVHYETTDVHFRTVMAVIVMSIVVLAITFWAMFAFLKIYQEYQARTKKSPYPLAPGPSTALPAQPRLEQLNHDGDIGTDESLTKHIPDEKGYVRIPIEQAMRLLDDKLPARAAPAADAIRRAGGLVDGGEPNSGRLFRRNR